MRRLAVLATILAVLPAGCRSGNGAAPRPVPVVLISIDTLRADRLPVYGYTQGRTPQIDRFAKDAVLFENAYSHVPLTAPSHASIFTGLLPPQHGVRDNIGYELAAKHRTLAERLKERGYATGGAVSAWVLRRATGLARGFDVYDDAVEASDTDAAGSAQRPGGVAEASIETFLDGVGERPFFAFLHLYEPHSPFTPPEPFKSASADPYDGEIAAADDVVGKLLDSLRRRGLYDRALVIVLSDHGEGLGDHGEEFHGILLYREVLRVPLLVKLPASARAGTRITAPVQLADVAPTIMAAVGAPSDAALAGRPVLDADPGDRRIYAETYYPRVHLGWSELRSLIGTRWHYIEGPKPELYDVPADPGEKSDLIQVEREAMRSMAKSLAAVSPAFDAPVAGTPEEMEKLAALGYLGGAVERAPGPPKNPRDELPVIDEVKKGFQLSAAHRDEEAVAVYRAVLAKNPHFSDAQYELGRVLARMGRGEEAFEAYRGAIRSAPALAGPLAITLARLSLELGRLDDAEAHARIALRQSPERAHEVLARVALQRGNLELAQKELAQTAGDDLAASNARVLEAEIRIREGRYDDALRVLREAEAQLAAKAAPPMLGMAFLEGDALARLARYPEAEAAFRREIDRFPKNTAAYTRLAIVFGLQHRTYGEVDRLLEQMLKASPDRRTAELAAETLRSMGDREGAARWSRRAGAMPSSNPPGH